MIISASAPGKLVLLGEYAVLAGAPALVAAVDRRAEARLEAHRRTPSLLRAPGLTDAPLTFRLLGDGTVAWGEGDATARALLQPIAAVVAPLIAQAAMTIADAPPFSATLLTQRFFEDDSSGHRSKLGLGSSAALTVALASALAALPGVRRNVEGDAWLQALVEAHRTLQGGLGSGLDVAASLCGGVLRYQLGGSPPRPQARALSLPGDLGLLFVWTGRSATTSRFLTAFEAWRRREPDTGRAAMTRLGAIAEAGLAAVAAGDAASLIEAMEAYAEALRYLGAAINIDIFSDDHARIAQLARRVGVAYKPCGAGGGDLGVAADLEADRLEQFRRTLLRGGYQTVPLQVETQGVRIDGRVI